MTRTVVHFPQWSNQRPSSFCSRRIGVFSLVTALAVMAPITSAQNLLINSSLEGVDGFPIPPGSCVGPDNTFWKYQCINEIETPTWWYPFWNEGPTPVDPTENYRRPEYRTYGWPDRVHFAYVGQHYLVYFGFWGAIDAGIYQQVSGVWPGTRYEFSYQGYAWSNCVANPITFPSGLDCDPFPDDQAVLKAGIDPTGGTDYTSASIIWSDGDSIYDAYDTAAVTATAAASTITVFVRCTFWHNYILHNDAHVDALELVALPGADIGLSTNRIDNAVYLGDPEPDDDIFTVTNSTAVGTMNYSISIDGSPTWLDVQPTQGSSSGEADDVTITYSSDISNFPVGNYPAAIIVSSDDAANSPQTVTINVSVQTVGPDLDGDTDVDQSDFGLFQACLSGTGVFPEPGCEIADFNGDYFVDQNDYQFFQHCMSGTDVVAARTCAAWAPVPPP